MTGVCLTGDIHSMQISYPEQAFLQGDISELKLGQKYNSIAERYGIDVTLFVSGLAAKSQPETLRQIAARPQTEIGGHTYRSLRPKLLHTAFRRFTGSLYGPTQYQRYDIKRTKRAIESILSEDLSSWRTHAYASDEQTPQILVDCGFTTISDDVVPASETHPKRQNGLLSIPVNTLRDHGHMYHAERTESAVAEAPHPGDEFCRDSFSPSEWGDRVIAQIREIVEEGGIATIQAHPICQYIADEFDTLERLVRWLDEEDISTYTCREVATLDN